MSRSSSRVTADLPGEIASSLNEGLGNDLVAVVLFGSRARGESREGSDWDVLVVASNLPGRILERAVYLKRMLPEFRRGEVGLLAKTPEEFAAGLPELYLDIAVDGVILHDADEYMAKRLRFLRAVIRDKGLRREKDGRNLIWRWRNAPGADLPLEWGDVS